MELLKEFIDAGWRRVNRYSNLDCQYYSVVLVKPLEYSPTELRRLVIEDLTYEKELSDFDASKPWNVGDWVVHSYTVTQDGDEYQYAITLSEMRMILRFIETVERQKSK